MDFFTIEVATLAGLVRYHALFRRTGGIAEN
jgi:hypothetical protein